MSGGRGGARRGGVAPGFLGAEPEGEAGDLDGAGVDVDAVDVVLDDEARDVAEVVFLFAVGFLESGTEPSVPGFFVDGLEEVEGVEAEVHGAAGGVEEADLARVFDGAVGDVDGLFEELFLAEGFLGVALGWVGGVFAFAQEDLGGAADEVTALVGEAGLAFGHLIPDAAEGVVGEELDDVARGEELVAHGELAGVARGGGGVAHGFALFLAVPVLVDPADGLVLGPDAFHRFLVEEIQELFERGFAGKE